MLCVRYFSAGRQTIRQLILNLSETGIHKMNATHYTHNTQSKEIPSNFVLHISHVFVPILHTSSALISTYRRHEFLKANTIKLPHIWHKPNELAIKWCFLNLKDHGSNYLSKEIRALILTNKATDSEVVT
jgi:hypothetical protein